MKRLRKTLGAKKKTLKVGGSGNLRQMKKKTRKKKKKNKPTSVRGQSGMGAKHNKTRKTKREPTNRLQVKPTEE